MSQEEMESQAAPPAAAPTGEHDPQAELVRERDELKDRLLRLAAEMDNYKKRSEREKAEFLKRANEGLLKDLLPVVDNLERAQAAEGEALKEGLGLVLADLARVLARHGLEPVAALGLPFDPERHEAMFQQEDADAEDNTVLSELQKGYHYQGRLLRPAMVVVSKRPAPAEEG